MWEKSEEFEDEGGCSGTDVSSSFSSLAGGEVAEVVFENGNTSGGPKFDCRGGKEFELEFDGGSRYEKGFEESLVKKPCSSRTVLALSIELDRRKYWFEVESAFGKGLGW